MLKMDLQIKNTNIVCKICGMPMKNHKALSNHLYRTHRMQSRDYYEQYLKRDGEGFCKICGRPTNYFNLAMGYRTYCSAECSRKDENIYKLAKETNLAKYGHTCSLANQDVRKKALDTKEEKYGNRYYCNSQKSREKYNQKTLEKYKADITDCDIISYKDKKFMCECKKCGTVFDITESLAYLRHYRYGISLCTVCFPLLDGSSGQEKEIADFIKSVYDGTVIENDRTVLDKKELDIYLPDRKIAFEFDGLFWHNELYKEKNYHVAKSDQCEDQGIQLIHIFEDEWKYQQDIVKSRICGLLGINTRIFARKCTIKEIPYGVSKIFLDQNHIQGNCMSTYRYGLYYNDELVSIMTFGKSRFNDEYELLRFCNKLNTNVVGGASRLFCHFMKEHREIKEIISFADRRWSVGNLYRKLGFEFVEKTVPSYFYVVDNARHNRIEFQKHKLIESGFDKNKTEHEIMLVRKIYRVYDCGNLKYRYTRNSYDPD